MNEIPADVPGILQCEVAKLEHTHILTTLLGDHSLIQVLTRGIPHWVRCGRVFVKETRAGWRGAECCTVSSGCIVRMSLPSAGAFFQMLFLPYDYICEQQEFMSWLRSDERLFISRKWQERDQVKGQVKGCEKLNTDESTAHMWSHPDNKILLHCNILTKFFSSPTATF